MCIPKESPLKLTRETITTMYLKNRRINFAQSKKVKSPKNSAKNHLGYSETNHQKTAFLEEDFHFFALR